jgi:hypothetical protein
MPNTVAPRQIAVVAGDLTIDWNLARIRAARTAGTAWNAEDRTRAHVHLGGSALLAELIQAVGGCLRDTANWSVRSTAAPETAIRPDDTRFHHSYAIWALARRDDRSRDASIWRVEEFLGLHRAAGDEGDKDACKRVADDAADADLVVLDDADLGFRDHPNHWPLAIKESSPWILLKVARPVAEGPLWKHLHQHHSERLIVLTTVNDLRLSEVQISRELSWERTAEDLMWELRYNPHVRELSDCAHVVVSFNTAGAMLLSNRQGQNAPRQGTLFFDPQVIEGMWSQKYPGGMIGYTSCLAASLALQLLRPPDQRDIDQGIQSGVAAMRRLHLIGYGAESTNPGDANLAFPTEEVVREIGRGEKPFAEAEVRDPARFLKGEHDRLARPHQPGFWTILQDSCDRRLDAAPLEQVALEIVLQGVERTLKGVPLGQFGGLLTVDRREIESYRGVRALINEYNSQERQERPLSIAVFGAPGSGKSFGISEVAKSVLPNRVRKLTFNLSQYNDPQELLGALHQVRDAALSGMMPLVFWDEFDTSLNGQSLGWLRYFLSPMQDGSFQEGQITHPIGRSIFVFAGGTSETREGFGASRPDEFRMAKGPDFVSRLKGFVNVLGPNPSGDAQTDPYFLIRRAILLRSMLERSALHLFRPSERSGEPNIDSGVLRALLRIQKYKHGARSMESIIAMSSISGTNRFERSCLPSEEQLNLHVNGRAFLALVQQIVIDDRVLEQLAEAAHRAYCAGLIARGDTARYGDVPYSRLPEHEKEQNRDNVRDIPSKLEAAGYVMTPARSNEPPFEFPGTSLEWLAEMEHERWMRMKVREGWRYGDETDRQEKLHKDIRPWAINAVSGFSEVERAVIGSGALEEHEKDKDRDLIRGIPRILAEAGYTVVRVDEAEAGTDE